VPPFLLGRDGFPPVTAVCVRHWRARRPGSRTSRSAADLIPSPPDSTLFATRECAYTTRHSRREESEPCGLLLRVMGADWIVAAQVLEPTGGTVARPRVVSAPLRSPQHVSPNMTTVPSSVSPGTGAAAVDLAGSGSCATSSAGSATSGDVKPACSSSRARIDSSLAWRRWARGPEVAS
jgi:hypothetical protein